MTIVYVTTVRFPTEKAHGWQIANMCEAYAALGHDVRLVVPDRATSIRQDAFAYYGLRSRFAVERLPVFDALAVRWIPRRVAFALTVWSFRRAARRRLTEKDVHDAILITRDQFLAPALAGRGRAVVFEAHDVSPRFAARHRAVARAADLVVSTTRWNAERLSAAWKGLLRRPVLVAPNAVDPESYASLPTRDEARRALQLSPQEHLAVYTGHLYAWKGVHVLAEASALLPPGFRVLMIGGTPEDRETFTRFLAERGLDQVVLVPHLPHAEAMRYLAAADVLVLPNSGKDWNSLHTTSPIKLLEYLAARRPVVSSDLPSIREAVSEREVRFVPPDDPAALAAGIAAAVGDDARVAAGAALVAGRTWRARAERILAALP
ncbi:glycosyltransferase [Patescibacteria group bacterium]|nr:MAG: glycosyltransferase [Patescibacteria group bacterium]